MRPVGLRVRIGDERGRREQPVEDNPHRVDPVVVRAGRIRVDRDPLLVRLAADAVVGGDEVRVAVDGRPPAGRVRGPVRPHRDGDHLGRLHGIRLLRLADGEVVAPVRVIEELVRKVELVIVAEAVERADRVGVVGPTLVPRHVTLHRPRRATIERLVEAGQVVVTLGADEPLDRADQMQRISRVDTNVRLGMVLDQLRRSRGIARVAPSLRRVRPRGARVLTRGRARTSRHARVAIVRPIVERTRVDLGSIAANPLRRRIDVRDAKALDALRVRRVGLRPLRYVPHTRIGPRRSRRGARRSRRPTGDPGNRERKHAEKNSHLHGPAPCSMTRASQSVTRRETRDTRCLRS